MAGSLNNACLPFICLVLMKISLNQLCISCFSLESTNPPPKSIQPKFREENQRKVGDKQEEANLPKFSPPEICHRKRCCCYPTTGKEGNVQNAQTSPSHGSILHLI